MRSLWKGSISFGLVNIPARLYAATEERDVHFRLLHRACGLPLRQRRHHPACQVDVEAGDVVRGFEYAPGAFALVEDEDLEALPLPTEKAVQIVSFVRAEAVDPILHHRSYFVELAVGGVKAYSLLRATLAEAGRVALAKMALRQRESLALLRLYAGVAGRADPAAQANGALHGEGRAAPRDDSILLLTTMLWPDEVRHHRALEAALRRVEVSRRELLVARSLVEALADPLRPEEHEDSYRRAVLELVEKKIAGRQVAAPAPPAPTPADDLLRALEESLRRLVAEPGLASPPGDGAAAATRLPEPIH